MYQALNGINLILCIILVVNGVRIIVFHVKICVPWHVHISPTLLPPGSRGQQADSRGGKDKGGDQFTSYQGQMGSEQIEKWDGYTQGKWTCLHLTRSELIYLFGNNILLPNNKKERKLWTDQKKI